MKRVKYLAAALPAAVGLAAPMTAAATTAAATVPTAHGKKVAYPHQQARLTALTRAASSSSASSGPLPQSVPNRCANGSISCMGVFGTGQYLKEIRLTKWHNSNGGPRTGFISYFNSSTMAPPIQDFRTRTKSEPKGVAYSFTWKPDCNLPASGWLKGHVGGHAARVPVTIESGNTTGPECSNT